MDTEVLLTYEDAAKIFSVSKRTIQNYVERGIIKAVKINRQTKRIKKSVLDALIDSLPDVDTVDKSP